MRPAAAATAAALAALLSLAPASPATGTEAPDPFLRPVLQDPQGRSLRLADFKGKIRVFDIWASWCGPCRATIPEMNELQQSYRDRGVSVIGVSVDDDPADVARFMRQVPIRYSHGMMNPDLAVLLGLDGGRMAIPITYVIDRRGKVRAKFVGLVNPRRIIAAIEALL